MFNPVAIALVGFLLLSGTAAADLTDGVVAEYRFDGGADDSSGNGHHGIVSGATLTEDRFGKPNGAYHFDGVDDYIEIPYHAALEPRVFSLSVWVKIAVPGGVEVMTIISSDPDASLCKHGYSISTRPHVSFSIDTAACGDSGGFWSDESVNDGRWHHVVALYDSTSTMTMFVDGELQSGSFNHGYDPTHASIVMGRSRYRVAPEGHYRDFSGSIDDLRIYDRLLNQAEIEQLWCGYFQDRHPHTLLLSPPQCTADAGVLTDGLYGRVRWGYYRGANDRLFLSASGDRFSPLVVDDELRIDGVDTGLGPYELQPGIPPFELGAPIEYNVVPLPAHEVTDRIPFGSSEPVLFELLDTQGEVYGNTAIYLVRDCSMHAEGLEPTIYWLSHVVQVAGAQSELRIATGLLSELRSDRGFDRAECLGVYVDSTVAVDQRPSPSAGEGRYYLVDGSCGSAIGFGDSSLQPDPRDALGGICR